MANPRIIIRRPDTLKVQYDSKTDTPVFVSKGSVDVGPRKGGNTNPGSVLIPRSGAGTTEFIAVQSNFTIAYAGIYFDGSTYYTHYISSQSSGTVYYWIFRPPTNLQPTRLGLNLRDPDSQRLTYSSDYEPLKIRYKVGGETSLPSGRTWAILTQSFAGRRTAPGDGVYYINGNPELWDGSPRDNNTTWAYQNDCKLYGFRLDGSTVYMGQEVSWDDIIAQLNNGPTPASFPPDWNNPMNPLLVVDVTNL